MSFVLLSSKHSFCLSFLCKTCFLLGDYLRNNMILGTLSQFFTSVVNQSSKIIQWLWLSPQVWTVPICINLTAFSRIIGKVFPIYPRSRHNAIGDSGDWETLDEDCMS